MQNVRKLLGHRHEKTAPLSSRGEKKCPRERKKKKKKARWAVLLGRACVGQGTANCVAFAEGWVGHDKAVSRSEGLWVSVVQSLALCVCVCSVSPRSHTARVRVSVCLSVVLWTRWDGGEKCSRRVQQRRVSRGKKKKERERPRTQRRQKKRSHSRRLKGKKNWERGKKKKTKKNHAGVKKEKTKEKELCEKNTKCDFMRDLL